VLGLVPAALLALLVAYKRGLAARRPVAAVLAATAIASVGVVALRAGDFDQFLRFVGAKHAQVTTSKNVQTYSQRTVLAYIGLRIWLHHPVFGVGWQASGTPAVFERDLPAAHRKFPHVSAIGFPSAVHPYGVQLLYVQVLADLGVVGLVLLAALAAAGLLVGLRGALRAPPLPALAATLGVFWLVLALGLWTAEGMVAGLPLDALTWLGFGLLAVREVEA
jgi:O-antigen ligase